MAHALNHAGVMAVVVVVEVVGSASTAGVP